MPAYTPFANGEVFNAAAFNSRFDSMGTAIEASRAALTTVTSYIDLSGLANYNITGIPSTIKMLRLYLRARTTAIVGYDIQINGDTAANYNTKDTYNGTSNSVNIPIAAWWFELTGPASTAGEFAINEFTIYNTPGTVKLFVAKRFRIDPGPITYYSQEFGNYTGASVISSINIKAGATTFASGSAFKLYSVKG